MQGHGGGLQHGGLAQAHGVGQVVQHVGRYLGALGEAAVTHQADEAHGAAQVVLAAPAVTAVAAAVDGLDCHPVADLETFHPFAQRADHAAEFVAEGQWCAAAGDRVRFVGGNGVRAVLVLVQVAAADAAVGDLDFHLAGLGSGGLQFVQAQVSGAMPA
ncbi:hypothetical protein D9M71_709960 [compost metagenome]